MRRKVMTGSRPWFTSFFFSSSSRHTRSYGDWSSDVCSSDLYSAMEDLLRDADTAMYQAKAAGRANYVVFDESMHASARQRLRIENELRAAIEAGQISTFYQRSEERRVGKGPGAGWCEHRSY